MSRPLIMLVPLVNPVFSVDQRLRQERLVDTLLELGWIDMGKDQVSFPNGYVYTVRMLHLYGDAK